MSVKRGEVEVRQRGGTLSSKWTKLYCSLDRTGVYYWDSRNDSKGQNVSPKETILLKNISDVHCIKSGGQEGFMFEIKSSSGQIKTQHLCQTDDERQKWVYAVMKTKSEPDAMPELESSEEEKKESKGKTEAKEDSKEKKSVKKQPTKKEDPSESAKGKDKTQGKKKTEDTTKVKKSDGTKRKGDTKSPSKKEKNDKETSAPVPPEPETDFANNTGTMVVTRSNPNSKKDPEVSYVNNSGTMMITKSEMQNAQKNQESDDGENDYASSTGTMVVAKTLKKPDPKEERARLREEFSSLSYEELKKWHDTKLEKKYKKECLSILRKWKEEKSNILDALRKKEIETIEQKYQQLQLDLERELQENREKIDLGQF